MGMFKKTKDSELKLNIFIEKLNITTSLDELQNLINRFGDEDLFYKYVEEVLFNNRASLNELIKVSSMLRSDEDFLALTKLVAIYPQLLNTNIITNAIYSFSDKKLVIEVLTYIINLYRNNETGKVEIENISTLERVVGYLVSARKHYVDDRSLFASFISLVNDLDINSLRYASIEEIDKVIASHIKEDKRSNGDYDISHEELEYFRQVVEELGVKSEQLKTLISLSDKNIHDTKEAYTILKQDVTEYAKKELGKLESQSTTVLSEFNQKYQELLNAEKNGILEDKDMLLRSLEAYLGEKRAELVSFANKIKMSCDNDLSNLRKEQRGILESIDSYIENSQSLQTLIASTTSDEAFLERIKNIEGIADEVAKKLQDVKIMTQTSTQVGTPQSTSEKANIVVPAKQIIVANPSIQVESPTDFTPAYFFDSNTSYKKRFDKLIEIKKKLMDEGEIFHECFDDVLTILIHNDVPYIYGPSGTGKTHMVENQISKILGLDVITSGYIQIEQDILGYNNAGDGGYVPSNFYRAFVLGNIIFFDELDISNPEAVPVLNGFFTGKKRNTYTFPNGVPVRRHPNFRIVTAGNTKGEGRTTEYSSRHKMDESVLQRIWAVECNYQSDIEEIILKDHEIWYEFSQSFRKAIEDIKLSNESGVNSFGTFTTRDAADVVEYLEDEAFNYKKIIKYKFVQTKDADYLALIYSNMLKDSDNYQHKDTKKLLKEFEYQMNARKNA